MIRTRLIKSVLFSVVLGLLAMSTTGCSAYMKSRYYDFRDTFMMGAGATAEVGEAPTWPFPPSLGVYVEASEFMHLGAITHNGVFAEVEGRGAGAGLESRTRVGIGPFHGSAIWQEYSTNNHFKRSDTPWQERMNQNNLDYILFFKFNKTVPAKELGHFDQPFDMDWQFFDFERGWQHWLTIGGEAAISDPITHLGFTLRLYLDPSEFTDFLLGWFTIDFKRDDILKSDLVNGRYRELQRETY